MLAGFSRHFESGLRRQVPEPVHGASTSTTSNRGTQRQQCGLVARLHDLHVAHARALQALEDRAELSFVGVVGIDLARVLHAGGERQRLAARACAQIENLLARRGTGEQGRDLRALVLHLKPALAVRGLGFEGRAARRPFGRGDAHALRRQRRRHTASLRSSAFKTFSRVAFSVLTLRSTGARALRAAPSSAAPAPNARSNDGSSQSGMSPAIAAGVSAGSAAPSRAVSSSVSGESACSEPSAVAATSAAVMPKARGAAPSASARGVSAPICAAMEFAASGRHKRECRWRSGRRNRRSGEPCPNRPAPWPPGGGAAGCPRAPRRQP